MVYKLGGLETIILSGVRVKKNHFCPNCLCRDCKKKMREIEIEKKKRKGTL